MRSKCKYLIGDFETTVYENQDHTEVWASACVELNTEDVKIFHSILEQYEYFISLDCDIVCYYHNLKFDGSFWIDFLLKQLKYEQAYCSFNDNLIDLEWIKERDMRNKTFKYSISDLGQWYYIIIKVNNHIIELRDSLKLLPFSVKRIGDSFNTKHKKLEMEYEGFRYAGCEITDKEKEYIANDVLVVKEALEIMFNEGHNSLTIGSCCLAEFIKTLDIQDYRNFLPNVYDIELTPEHTYETVGDYIKKSYRGGWCYLVKGKENKIFNNGTTADVNSLYPSMMSSESGNRYPVGKPTFWYGNYIPDVALRDNMYYFVRVKTRFYLKPDKLPFIQIKGSFLYKLNEMLESSDFVDRKTGKHYTKYKDVDGTIKDTRVEMVMTMTDYELFKEHYDLVDFEIIDGCYFHAIIGLFDEYIEKYKKIKMESKGAKRELAKLFLNNLYGKMATSKNSSFKVAIIKDDGNITFKAISRFDKTPGYIPIGSAITSYARNFTIRAAQKNYYGKDKAGFIYADTDSIHCDLPASEIKGINVHDKNFCCWKLESSWDIGLFVRQKTYIEHIVAEDLQPIDEPYYNIKCAGMPEKCKNLFKYSMCGCSDDVFNSLNETEKEFVKVKRDLTDFKVGLIVPSKLLPKRIEGGIVLQETTYEMR